MVDVDDIQGHAKKFENELERLEEAAIDRRDRTAILRLIRRLDGDGLAKGTIINHSVKLRKTAERVDGRLVEMDLDAVDAHLFELKHDRGLSEGTIRNYRKSFRKLFGFLDREWAEDIKIGTSPKREVDPSELLTDEEIDALFDACHTPRDKALLALLLDTGLRIGAVASLRVRDVELTQRAGSVTINQDADVKGASGTVPITWSRGYVANLLEMHPRSDEPDAALIHKNDTTPDDDDDGAMQYYVLHRHLKRLASRAGVNGEKVKPHTFRKTAISTWVREGFSEQEIKHRASWVKDSSQFEIYSGVADEELNEQILERYGLSDGEGTGRPTIDTCPQCGVSLDERARFCLSCGAPLTPSAGRDLDAAEDATVERMIEADSADERQVLMAFRNYLRSNPDALPEDLHEVFSSD